MSNLPPLVEMTKLLMDAGFDSADAAGIAILAFAEVAGMPSPVNAPVLLGEDWEAKLVEAARVMRGYAEALRRQCDDMEVVN